MSGETIFVFTIILVFFTFRIEGFATQTNSTPVSPTQNTTGPIAPQPVSPTQNTTGPIAPQFDIPTLVPTASNGTRISQMCQKLNGKIAIVAAVALIIIGLCFLFFGYKIHTKLVFVIGFLIVFGLVFILLQSFLSHKLKVGWILLIAAIAGAIAGSLLIRLLSVGIFLMGFGIGIVVWSLILSTPIGTTVIKCCDKDSWYPIIVMVICGIAGGVLALVFQRLLIIIATSLGGAYAIAFALDCAFLHSSFCEVVPAMITLKRLDIRMGSAIPYILMVGVIVLAVAGMLVQLKYTGRKRNDSYNSVN